jgi:uncharacterized protein
MQHSFPRPPRFRLSTRRSGSGLGLFADESIPANRFLIEYWGDLLVDEEAQKIGGKYLFELENGKTIVGATRQNTARYANHSCRPNSEVRIVGDRVFLFSLRRIEAGEEIGYDYGKEYFDYYIKPYGCKCYACRAKSARASRSGKNSICTS